MMIKIPVIKSALLILSILMTGSSRTRAEIEVPVNSNEAPKIEVTWSYLSVENEEEIHTEIEKALDYWATPATSFTFKETPNNESADLNFLFVRVKRHSFVKEVGEVACSVYQDGKPNGAVFVNMKEDWTYVNKSDSEAADLRIVLEHQLGYILGQESSAHFAAITALPNYNVVKLKLSTSMDETNKISERYISPNKLCEPRFDVVTDFEGDHVGFAGKYMYSEKEDRFDLIRDRWTQLPENLTKVDAVYNDPSGFKLFFIGKQVYKFQGSNLAADYPKDLRLWLNESRIEHVDEVVTYSKGIHVISGLQYWKLHRTSLGDFGGPIGKPMPTGIAFRKGQVEMSKATKLQLKNAVQPKWKDFVCRPDQDFVRRECCNI